MLFWETNTYCDAYSIRFFIICTARMPPWFQNLKINFLYSGNEKDSYNAYPNFLNAIIQIRSNNNQKAKPKS